MISQITFLWLLGWLAAGFGIVGFATAAIAGEIQEVSGIVSGIALVLFAFLVIVGCILLGNVQ